MVPPAGSRGPGGADLVADLAADPTFICELPGENDGICGVRFASRRALRAHQTSCLLYTSDAAGDAPCVDLGGR
eukprot:1806824-Pyramimonas_sp.AAC.1